ncbi:MAG: adenosylmethionine--8-amino-7-oxononanoate transaminase [Thermoflavifilum sp.]|nr:adenosylmethionine--8-amino-7-oxononanoate transaminase [Thermoflavifilum sp.]
MPASSLLERDARVIWHPDTQMLTEPAPIPIVKGEGALLFDEQGQSYIDADASWWVNTIGHGHPLVAEKIAAQARHLAHCIFACLTHEPAVKLAEELLRLLPGNFSRIFYSDDGSTSTEVALKMAIQYWHNQGIKRTKILALEGGYHGDTFGAMSVGAKSVFTAPFENYLFEVTYLPLPQPGQAFPIPEEELDQYAAWIFEPLIQGAGGMRMYRAEALDPWLEICRRHGILLIADEVMTGFYRTGRLFACEYLQQKPDIICLSKGLTGGTLPLGVTACTEQIFEAFLSQDKRKTFFHGHSYTANPLACTAALASLDVLLSPAYQSQIQHIIRQHQHFVQQLHEYPCFQHPRQLGTIAAFEVIDEPNYTSPLRDKLYTFYLKHRVLMRPLGNTLYLMPPYCITNEQLQQVYEATFALAETLLHN